MLLVFEHNNWELSSSWLLYYYDGSTLWYKNSFLVTAGSQPWSISQVIAFKFGF